MQTTDLSKDKQRYVEQKYSTTCRCGKPKGYGRSMCPPCINRSNLGRKNRKRFGKLFPEPVWIIESYINSGAPHLPEGVRRYPCFYVCARLGEGNRCSRVSFRYSGRTPRVEAFTSALSFAWTCWLLLKGRVPKPGEIKVVQAEGLQYFKQTKTEVVWRRL